ncbi:MAG: ABC transporter ATP-binding protein [Acidobacteriota bacterium]
MKPIRQLLSYTTLLRPLFIAVATLSVFTAVATLVTPFIMKFGTDWVVAIAAGKQAFSIEPLIGLIAALIAVYLLDTIMADTAGYLGDMIAIRTRRQLSKLYYQHLLTLPQHYYDGEVTGKIVNRLSRAISDVTQFLQFFSNHLLDTLLTVAVTVIVLVWYSWPLALLFLLLIPANLYITTKTSGKWQKYEGQKNNHFDIASGRFAEVVAQMRLVKSFGAEKRELHKFDSEVAHMEELTSKQSVWWHSMNALRSIIYGTIFAAIYGILFYQTARGAFTVGDMVLLLTLIQQIIYPMRSMSFFVDSYQRAVANSKDFLAAMAETPEREPHTRRKLRVTKGTIVYHNVSFAYESGKEVLHGVDAVLTSGKKIALVGESGGGKTTISNLLMRLYDPTEGSISIDGVNIASVSRASVRQHIATVFQDAALFSGTIRENIAYAVPDASEKAIMRAAEDANALRFIRDFPDGLDTEIGERGIKLSGGQRQRIAIARAILKDAPILILDEATSSLDSKAEHEVQQALDRLMKGRTTLIIAHRLSTIANADTIITLKNGAIDEVGSPAQLAVTDGIYATLLKLQLGATERAKQQLEAFDIAA